MIRLFYTKTEGGYWWPVEIEEDGPEKILAVCKDEENWVGLGLTALVGLKCWIFSTDLKKVISTELLVFHSFLFKDSSTWESTLRKVLPSLSKNRFEEVEKYWKESSANWR